MKLIIEVEVTHPSRTTDRVKTVIREHLDSLYGVSVISIIDKPHFTSELVGGTGGQ